MHQRSNVVYTRCIYTTILVRSRLRTNRETRYVKSLQPPFYSFEVNRSALQLIRWKILLPLKDARDSARVHDFEEDSN